MKKFIFQNWFKLVIIICILLLVNIFWLYIDHKIESENFKKDLQCRKENPLYQYNKKTNTCEKITLPKIYLPNCNFSLADIQEYKGDYSKQSHYIVYEGIIKNNSDKKHLLEAMITKIYTKDDVLVTEGYTSIQEWVEPGKAIPFKIHNSLGNKFFNEDIQLKSDIYPWFLTCK